MKIIKSITELRQERQASSWREVSLVPTMGALHEGHLSLFQIAREAVGDQGSVMVSIFVNPLQFDNSSDLKNYPSPLTEDLAKCEAQGVDLVFCPPPAELYYGDASITVSESLLSQGLCGATRPGHFDGVCTVVLKLYHLFQPKSMVFGEKDFQQLAIIRRLVRDLNIPVEIIEGPTVREESGLALSSRNTRLTETERTEAAMIYTALKQIKEKVEGRAYHVETIAEEFQAALETVSTPTKVDYIEFVKAETLQPATHNDVGKYTLAVAVFFKEVRLIDHISIDLS